MTYIV